jgi:hypothetical protein
MAYRIVNYILRKIKFLENNLLTNPARQVLDERVSEHSQLVADLIDHPEVQYTKNIDHHRYHSRYDHMLLASKFAYYFALRTGADVRVCVRAAAIHDVWTKGMYCLPAVEFAKKIGEPKAVQQAIATHMVLNKPPRDKNGWVVAFADECAWGVESLEWLRLITRDMLSWMAEISPLNIK